VSSGSLFLLLASKYINAMLSRSPRGRPHNAPSAFINPCQPTVATKPPAGPGWAHELKHDYRLQIHVRDGRVRLYTMNGADWSKGYPLIIQDAARIKGSAILNAEAVWLDANGMADFEALHSRSNDGRATALASDLLMLNDDDMRRKPYVERKAALRKLLPGRGVQYVEHAEEHGEKLFAAVCKLGLEGIVSKKLALSIGAVESLDQSQKSEGTSRNSRN